MSKFYIHQNARCNNKKIIYRLFAMIVFISLSLNHFNFTQVRKLQYGYTPKRYIFENSPILVTHLYYTLTPLRLPRRIYGRCTLNNTWENLFYCKISHTHTHSRGIVIEQYSFPILLQSRLYSTQNIHHTLIRSDGKFRLIHRDFPCHVVSVSKSSRSTVSYPSLSD